MYGRKISFAAVIIQAQITERMHGFLKLYSGKVSMKVRDYSTVAEIKPRQTSERNKFLGTDSSVLSQFHRMGFVFRSRTSKIRA